MTNYREEFRYFKKMMYVAGRQILEAPWVFVLSMLFGIFLNTIVHSYFNGFTNTLKLMVDHPLAMGLAPCVYGRTPFWAFSLILVGAFLIGYYGGRAYYEYRWRYMFNSPNWGTDH